MEPLPKWKKIRTSTPFVFIAQTLTAIVIALFVRKPSHFSWTNVVIISLFYGVSSTIAIKSYAERYMRSLGLSNQQQMWALSQAIKKCEIPADKEVQHALPAFLDRRLKLIEKQKKSVPLYFTIFGIASIGGILSHNFFEIAIFILFLAFGVYSYFYYKKTVPKLIALQAKLEKRGIKFDEVAKSKNVAWEESISRSGKSKRIMGVASLVVLLALIVFASYPNSPNKIATQLQPNFTSTKYDFKIYFPGTPTTNNYSVQPPDCGNTRLPYALFQASPNYYSEQIYIVYAYAWPKQDTDFASMTQPALKNTLDSFMNDDIQTLDARQNNVTYKPIVSGHSLAEESSFTMTGQKQEVNGYDRVFTVGNFQYDVIGESMGKADFDSFANSFQFTGSLDKGVLNNGSGSSNTACVYQNTIPNAPTDQSTNDNTNNSSDNGSDSNGIPNNATLQLQ